MTRDELLTALQKIVSPYGLVNDLRGDRLEDAGHTYHLYRARINAIGKMRLLTPPLAGFGLGSDEDDARLKAICEALERFCGVNFAPSTFRGDWSSVFERALDPMNC